MEPRPRPGWRTHLLFSVCVSAREQSHNGVAAVCVSLFHVQSRVSVW